MSRITTLTRRDIDLIQSLSDKVRRSIGNPQNRPHFAEEELWTPEVYVARTPAAGIPALTKIFGQSIEDQPGYADCYIYRVLEQVGTGGPELQPISGLFRRIYNLNPRRIGGNRWVLAIRDKFGNWFITNPGIRPEDTDYGTGTGFNEFTGTGTESTDTTPPCGVIQFYVYQLLCESGDLNEYRQSITIDNDDNGCLRKTLGNLEFVRTVACCDSTCADPGTGTDAGGVPAASGTGTGAGEGIVTGCCSNALPTTLTVTVTNKTGSCTCLPNSFTITWDGTGYWVSSAQVGCGGSTTFRMSCAAPSSGCNGFRWSASGTCNIISTAPTGCTCDPLSLVFDISSFLCCTGGAKFTVTE